MRSRVLLFHDPPVLTVGVSVGTVRRNKVPVVDETPPQEHPPLTQECRRVTFFGTHLLPPSPVDPEFLSPPTPKLSPSSLDS